MTKKIALAGNPNCGKTTLFNALTGSNQFVGNWPGVTVEKKEGTYRKDNNVIFTDLPGIYSLSPYTLEEVVARKYLLEEKPDAVLNIIDGTNLERNLYLTTQILEMGIPVVAAINMMDAVKKNGDKIELDILEKQLGIPVVAISALKEEGIDQAAEIAIKAAEDKKSGCLPVFQDDVEQTIEDIEKGITPFVEKQFVRFHAVKLFERDPHSMSLPGLSEALKQELEQKIAYVEKTHEEDAPSLIINERYAYIEALLKTSYCRKQKSGLSASERIDSIVTNRFLAIPIFALTMFLVYYLAMGTIGGTITEWMNDTLFGEWVPGWIESGLSAIGVAEWLKALILDGIVAGVGAVLGFVPQMFILFFLLSFLEACGYMSRIAFVLDRLFRKFGLSGKSFIPMFVGTGCGVPGIMASRTIENEKDRRMTIITTTFLPCGAKIPFIALIAGALFGGSPWVAASAYFMGLAAIVISGLILKRTKPFAGEPSPFVMELPTYHMPTLKNLWRATWERGWSFVKKAGTIILLSSVIIWFVTFFGWTPEGFRMLTEEELGYSMLAVIGRAVCWIFVPLGWGEWQAAVASLTGLVAKENIVGTLGVLYGTNKDTYAQLATVFTPVAGYSFLAFNLLCAPCFAAIGAIKEEMNSRKWTWFAILYQTGFAYVVALLINLIGTFVTTNEWMKSNWGTLLVGIILLLVIVGIVLHIRRNKKKGIGSCGCNCKNCPQGNSCKTEE